MAESKDFSGLNAFTLHRQFDRLFCFSFSVLSLFDCLCQVGPISIQHLYISIRSGQKVIFNVFEPSEKKLLLVLLADVLLGSFLCNQQKKVLNIDYCIKQHPLHALKKGKIQIFGAWGSKSFSIYLSFKPRIEEQFVFLSSIRTCKRCRSALTSMSDGICL